MGEFGIRLLHCTPCAGPDGKPFSRLCPAKLDCKCQRLKSFIHWLAQVFLIFDLVLRKVFGVALAAMLFCSLALADERWMEIAALHDGSVLEVKRSVEFKRGSSDLTSFFNFYPTTYSISFKHPDLPVAIHWKGRDDIHPIAMDFSGHTPFLVVYGAVAGVMYENKILYGCPEIPYAWLRFDVEGGNWIPVSPNEAPEFIRNANLALRWDRDLMRKRRLAVKDIEEEHKYAERSNYHHFSRLIPRSFDEWRYAHKKRDQTTRYRGDCRTPLENPVDVVFPRINGVISAPVVVGELEVVGREDFAPPRIIDDRTSEWREAVWDAKRAEACKSLVRTADQEDARLQSWVAFVHDSTGRALSARRPALCDKDGVLWFFGNLSSSPENNQWVIAKVSRYGDVLYRLSFKKPDHWGFIARPTFISKDGYLYFDWWDASTGVMREVKKILKVRLKEPITPPFPRPVAPAFSEVGRGSPAVQGARGDKAAPRH